MALIAELAVVFAAGKGLRMRSALPKVMHHLAGMSLIGHVVKIASTCAKRVLLVVSNEIYEECRKNFPHALLALQEQPDGTGEAAARALVYAEQQEQGDATGSIVFLNADTPLITAQSLQGLLKALKKERAALALLGFYSENPTGYGRLLGATLDDKNNLSSTSLLKDVREEEDCNIAEKAHPLCNAGVYATRIEHGTLRSLLASLPLVERGGGKIPERRLTDLVGLCNLNGEKVLACWVSEEEAVGVNSAEQLASAEGIWQRRTRAEMLREGVFLRAPETVFFSHDTRIEAAAVVEPYVCFGCNVEIGAEALIRSFCHIEGAQIAPKAVIGPFARLRATSNIGKRVKIGNFVETKNVTFATDAKVSHLSYIGDCTIAEKANIGAGVITCNYDGEKKHRTHIGAAAFVGSNSSLIAPISVGDGARIGASSAIDTDVPDNTLAFERSELTLKPLKRSRGKKDTASVTNDKKRGNRTQN